MGLFAVDPALQGWLRLWAKVLVASCVGMVAFVLVVLWVLDGFHGLGLHASIAAALLLGTIVSTALGVTLMGLIFYSNRSGTDESAGGTYGSENSKPAKPSSSTSGNGPQGKNGEGR